MEATWQQLRSFVENYLPDLLLALGILVLGWIAAWLVAAIVRAGLRRTGLDNRLSTWLVGEERAAKVDVAGWTGRVVFYLLMLLVLVAFFQQLGLTLVTEPLNSALNRIFEFLPRLVGAGFLLLVAWLVASAVRLILSRLPGISKLDENLGDAAGLEGAEPPGLGRTIADTAFWLTLLLFLPAVLGTLALDGLLNPVQQMVAKVLSFLPNLFSAGIILLIGWFIARILQRVVTNLLVAVGADRLSDQAGISRALGEQKLSGMIGLILYVLVLIPVAVSALDALQLEAISRPASDLLNRILSALPSIFAAIVVIAVAWIVGRLVAGLVTSVLASIGFDTVLARLGLGTRTEGAGRTPSSLAGFVVMLAIMLLASMEAFRLVGFTLLAEFIGQFNVFAARLLLGIVIFGLALFLANLVHERVSRSGTMHAGLLAMLSRVAILVLGAAMAIQHMGIGSEIVELVLTYALGAIAIAIAIAFGLGAQKAAGELVERWFRGLRAENRKEG